MLSWSKAVKQGNLDDIVSLEMEKEHGTSMTPQKGVPFNSKPGQYNKTTHFVHTNLKMNLRNAKQTLTASIFPLNFL